jgi:hypothetical protein
MRLLRWEILPLVIDAANMLGVEAWSSYVRVFRAEEVAGAVLETFSVDHQPRLHEQAFDDVRFADVATAWQMGRLASVELREVFGKLHVHV